MPETTSEEKRSACFKCFKPAVWEKFGFAYCKDHIPDDSDQFEPEAHEVEVIDAIKKLEGMTETEERDLIDAWSEPEPSEGVRVKKFNRLHKRRQL